MNVFQKQLIINGKTQAEKAVEDGWYGNSLEDIKIPKKISVEDFEKWRIDSVKKVENKK